MAIPLPFYFVNILGHLPILDAWIPSERPIIWIVVLTTSLVATTGFVDALLYRWRHQLRIGAPLALTLGGTLGLLHWFPLYAICGQLFLWTPVRQLTLLEELQFMGACFAIPILSLSGATYDASVLGILASLLLLVCAGLTWRFRLDSRCDEPVAASPTTPSTGPAGS